MKILSIETSCDDTCISIFEAKGGKQNAVFKILANNSNSQINIHRPYGGVYPVLAKREHAKNLPIILEASLKQAKLDKKPARRGGEKPVDAIAVTYGPGLEMCLWEGITFAQGLAKKWKVLVIPVNHMEGHILSVFGKNKGKFAITKTKFPVLALLVSGGHTELVLVKDWGKYEVIGKTLDDAAGEAFDKVARMMDLPYPGGPEISKMAEKGRHIVYKSLAQRDGASRENFQQKIIRAFGNNMPAINLPRPMLHSKNFDFSFSGLKTAVLYLIRKIGKLNEQTKIQIAMEFENAVIETLVYKSKKAIEKYGVKTMIIAGGVAANKYLRKEMQKALGKEKKLLVPGKGLSTDNSIMIGIAGYLHFLKKKKFGQASKIKAVGNLKL